VDQEDGEEDKMSPRAMKKTTNKGAILNLNRYQERKNINTESKNSEAIQVINNLDQILTNLGDNYHNLLLNQKEIAKKVKTKNIKVQKLIENLNQTEKIAKVKVNITKSIQKENIIVPLHLRKNSH
jgi:hypothetical protein